MDKTDRDEKEDAQKAKLIFLSLAALVAILLIWSLYSGNKARSERDAAQQKSVALEQDNAKLEQLLKEQSQELDTLKKRLQQCEAKPKAKPAAKKKATTKKSTKKSKAKSQ